MKKVTWKFSNSVFRLMRYSLWVSSNAVTCAEIIAESEKNTYKVVVKYVYK